MIVFITFVIVSIIAIFAVIKSRVKSYDGDDWRMGL